MELPNQEAEMPIPLNSTYGGTHGHTHAHVHGHMIHHHHDPPPPISHNHIISSPPIHHPQIPPSGAPISSDHDHDDEDDDDNNNNNNNHHHLVVPFKKNTVKYKECLKNHAASMGGNATDGCGEFMPSGDDGTLEALTCSACNCHRNFHRKEIEGECENININNNNNNGYSNVVNNMSNNPKMGRKVYLGHHRGYLGHDGMGYPQVSLRAPHPHLHNPHPHHQMIMSYNMGGGGGTLPSESDEMEGNGGGGGAVMRAPPMAKKRFRTKFTAEQKEKMLSFAEKVGWKIQKQEEGVVQQFCQEVGVKRRVLKVWMHNNKHNLAKKTNLQPTSENQV